MPSVSDQIAGRLKQMPTANATAFLRKLRALPSNVFVLGWVSFFTDLASEMLYPVLPLFVVGTLGASPAILGLIDGVAEGISSGLRWVGGALSDKLRRRKPFVVAGYAISAISKPLMGFAAYAGGWPVFFLGRGADRLGKSIRTAARDALITDSTQPSDRGLAFGLHRAMDTVGAVIGPLLVLVILWVCPGVPLAWLFFIALMPGVASALVATLAVRDVPHTANPDARPAPILQRYPRSVWHLILANLIFSLGNSSDSFLLLRSKQLGLSFAAVVLAYTLYNAVHALSAVPLGSLSDRIGRKPVIIAGWSIYSAVYLGFGVAHSTRWPWLLLAAYGLYQAMTEGVTKAMISDLVPSHQRAGSIGLFYMVSGVGQLVASLVAGCVWHLRVHNGQIMVAFLIGAIASAVALPIVGAVPNRESASLGRDLRPST